jgi:hypothetical protein
MEQSMNAEKIEAEIAKLMAETMKIQAESMKIQAEAKWYPFVVTAGMFAAAIGVVKIFM